MTKKRLIVGKIYRHKDYPNYIWIKVLKILMPHHKENTTDRVIVKCFYSADKNSNDGFVKYFRPSYLIDDEK